MIYYIIFLFECKFNINRNKCFQIFTKLKFVQISKRVLAKEDQIAILLIHMSNLENSQILRGQNCVINTKWVTVLMTEIANTLTESQNSHILPTFIRLIYVITIIQGNVNQGRSVATRTEFMSLDLLHKTILQLKRKSFIKL